MSKAQKPSLEIDEPWLAQRMKQLEEELKG